ncbi:MAG: hypothetical protein ACUVYA_08215 [Planctomycetota bacterium]
MAKATYRLKKAVGASGSAVRFSDGLATRGAPPFSLYMSVEGKTRIWTNAVDGVIRPMLASENCWNGKDDDGDGLTDLEDPDCATVPSGAPHVQLEVDAEGSTPLERGRELEVAGPDAEFEAKFWLRPMFLVGLPGPQSWSISVEHTPRALEVREPTIDGTDAGALLGDGFQRTEIADPAKNGGRAGFVSTVVLSLSEPRALDPTKRNSLARANYRVLASDDPLAFPAFIEFSDGLIAVEQSVRNEFVLGGVTAHPELTLSFGCGRGNCRKRGCSSAGTRTTTAAWTFRTPFTTCVSSSPEARRRPLRAPSTAGPTAPRTSSAAKRTRRADRSRSRGIN